MKRTICFEYEEQDIYKHVEIIAESYVDAVDKYTSMNLPDFVMIYEL